MSSPGEWYSSLPPISKFFGTSCTAVTVAMTLGLVDPYSLLLNWGLIGYKFQVWRLLTNLVFLGPLKLPFLIRMLMIIRYGVTLEKVTFERRTADFLFMIIFCAGVMLLGSLLGLPFFSSPVFGPAMCFVFVYVWSRNFPTNPVNLMGVMQLQAFYLPWALVCLEMIMGGDFVSSLIGIFAGHLYYFLSVIHPAAGGRDIVHTPRFIKQFIQDVYGGYGFVNDAYRAPERPERRAFQGRGQRLGG